MVREAHPSTDLPWSRRLGPGVLFRVAPQDYARLAGRFALELSDSTLSTAQSSGQTYDLGRSIHSGPGLPSGSGGHDVGVTELPERASGDGWADRESVRILHEPIRRHGRHLGGSSDVQFPTPDRTAVVLKAAHTDIL